MAEKSSLLTKKNIEFLAWIAVLPFLVSWPFLSIFPVFSLMGSTTFDVSTLINLLFFFTGFWPILIFLAITWWLTHGNLHAMIGSGKAILIGGYSVLWTALYILAAFVAR
jgi:hypothetical protein